MKYSDVVPRQIMREKCFRFNIIRKAILIPSGLALLLVGFSAAFANDAMPLEKQMTKHLENWSYTRNQIVFRFAIGGDLHYGLRGSKGHTQELVEWLNAEKRNRGLDLFFLNGDIVHDTTNLYEELRDEHLAKLEMPFYAIKGNHDFLRKDQSWEKIWGYPENHVVATEHATFVFADTSVDVNHRNHYSAADTAWLAKALERLNSRKNVFVIMHIAQRAPGVTVNGYTWPQYGVGDRGRGDVEAGEANMKTMESHDNVRAVFHSHNHRKVTRYMSGGKPYFFCGRLGGSLLRGNIRRGYRVVEMYDNGAMATYYWNAEDKAITSAHWIKQK